MVQNIKSKINNFRPVDIARIEKYEKIEFSN